MTEKDNIEALLEKYELRHPVSRRDRARIYRSKKRTLPRILREGERPGLMLRVSTGFYYFFQNLRLPLTLAQARGASVFALAVLIVSAAAGGLLVGSRYYGGGVMTAVKTEAPRFRVLAAVGNVRLLHQGRETPALKSGDLFPQGDTLLSDGSGSALLALQDGSMMHLLPGSRLAFGGDAGLPSFDLREGGVLFRVAPLKERRGWEVHTPDALVRVSGTEFGVMITGGRTAVFVTRGSVLVTYRETGASLPVPEGRAADVTGEMKLRELKEREKALMKGFLDLLPAESPGKAGRGDPKELTDKMTSMLEGEKKSTAVKKRLTLEDLRARYGRLEEVYLYSGKRYTGVVLSNDGNKCRILTPGGAKTVPPGT